MGKVVKRALWILAASLAIAAIFWSATSEPELAVRAAKVELLDPHSSVSTNGKVEAGRTYELRAPVSGLVQSIAVREGDLLEPGRTVLVLDDQSLRSDLAAARAELSAAEAEANNIERGPAREELNQAEAEVARLRLEVDAARKTVESNEWLVERKAVARQELEDSRRALARAEQSLRSAVARRDDVGSRYGDFDRRRSASRLEAARTRVAFLERSISRAAVRAPARGTLYQFEVKDGTYLAAGDLIGMLADLAELRVRAYVDEPELGRVHAGSEIVVRWDARPGQFWKGTVARMPAAVVARGSRSVGEVLCSLVAEPADLIPNVNVDVEIMTSSGPKVAALPRAAVFQEGKDEFVWAIQDGRAVKRKVETGRSSASIIEITRGVGLGEAVILLGEVPIAQGARVRVAE